MELAIILVLSLTLLVVIVWFGYATYRHKQQIKALVNQSVPFIIPPPRPATDKNMSDLLKEHGKVWPLPKSPKSDS